MGRRKSWKPCRGTVGLDKGIRDTQKAFDDWRLAVKKTDEKQMAVALRKHWNASGRAFGHSLPPHSELQIEWLYIHEKSVCKRAIQILDGCGYSYLRKQISDENFNVLVREPTNQLSLF